MVYKTRWNLLKHRLKEHEEKAKQSPDEWVTLLTTQIILEMMNDIEKEVQENET